MSDHDRRFDDRQTAAGGPDRRGASHEGWWEQHVLGRQAMHALALRIAGQTLTGSGTDIVGDFRMSGTLHDGGLVSIDKRYIDGHSVLYTGEHDGEGRMWGLWSILGWNGGRWMIRAQRAEAAAADQLADVVDLTPSGQVGSIGSHTFPGDMPCVAASCCVALPGS